jgi:hypothetical protein
MSRSLGPVRVPVSLQPIHETKTKDLHVIHAYVAAGNWPAGRISDDINPRSHDENVLDTPVAKAILGTLRDKPDQFVYANRGILVLASDATVSDGSIHLKFEGNPAVMGLADGGTTDAVLAAFQKGQRDTRADHALVHVEVIVGLDDPDLVAALVEGRNTSRQVRQASLVNASGRFDWLKEALPEEMRKRIAWEENQVDAVVPVSELLALAALFRPSFGATIEEIRKSKSEVTAAFDETERAAEQAYKCFKGRSKLAAELRDEATLADFRATAPLLPDAARLYDDLCLALAAHADAKVKKSRSAATEGKWNRAFPPVKSGQTPFTGRAINRKVPPGWVFPYVFAARQFQSGARWTTPVEQFAPTLVAKAVIRVESALDGGLTADRFASGNGFSMAALATWSAFNRQE